LEDLRASACQVLLARSLLDDTQETSSWLQDDDACIFCDQAAETMDHIILGCVYSREVWATCLRRFLLHDLVVVVQEEGVMVWWTNSRKRLPKEIRRGFDSLFFLVGWLLQKERNA
jgi:hypothetical protein